MDLERSLKLLGAVGALASFLWGIWVWRDNSHREQRSREIEAKRPFLSQQLLLYTEASKVAAIIATSDDAAEVAKARQRFLQLYWGELALVENRGVESAMVHFKQVLDGKRQDIGLEQASLDLAKACRESLDRSWGVNIWTNPDQVSPKAE